MSILRLLGLDTVAGRALTSKDPRRAVTQIARRGRGPLIGVDPRTKRTR